MKAIAIAVTILVLLTGCTNNSEKEKAEQADLVKRAEAGDVEAMYSIFFRIAQKGSPGNPQSDEEVKLAKYWLIKAGENNSWRAAYALQLCYEKGCWGLPIDLDKSKHYSAIWEKYRPNAPVNGETSQRVAPTSSVRK